MNVFDLAKNKVSNVFDKVKSFYPTQKQGMSFRVGEGLNPSQEASAQSTLANLTQEKNPLQETISGIKSNLGSAYNNIIKPAASSLYEGAKNIKEDINETLKGGQDEIRKITSKVFPSYKISDLSDTERKEIFDKGQIIKDGLILRANKTPDGKIKDDLSAMDFTGVGAVKSVGKNIEKSAAKNIVDPLLQEAKKYKSAEEFVKAQGKVLYSGGQDVIKKFRQPENFGTIYQGKNHLGAGIYITENPKYAKYYGENLTESIIPKDIKIFDLNKELDVKTINKVIKSFIDEYSKTLKSGFTKDVTSELAKATDANELLDILQNEIGANSTTILQRAGFDAIKTEETSTAAITGLNPDAHGIVYNIFDPKNIKTKSQLTDIWNEAHGKSSLY